MAYVINGGDTPTTSFQKFSDLCCAGYNELRKNCNLFINLLELVSYWVIINAKLYAYVDNNCIYTQVMTKVWQIGREII